MNAKFNLLLNTFVIHPPQLSNYPIIFAMNLGKSADMVTIAIDNSK